MEASAVESRSGAPDRCVRCSAPLESPVGCRECHSVFPANSSIDHFLRLGLPRSYQIDSSELENRFLAWSRELHPDFFAGRPGAEQELSLELSAKLNDAYATLKNPFRRAEYLLQLLGGPSASEQRSMPEEFLERILELRMEIEDAKEAGEAAIARLEAQLAAERAHSLDRVARAFEKLPARPASTDLATIRGELNSIKYLDGLLRDLDG